MDAADALQMLDRKVTECTRCPRLASYIREVGKVRVRRYMDQEYWARPVPGFGDPAAKVLVVGLAPAAHGANRTGRMFTGDSSGDWLYRALYETGFANQPMSINKEDGLKLKDLYIGATIRCAPPQNKPLPQEITNCRTYLEEEFRILNQVKVYLALGQIGFRQLITLLQPGKINFSHHGIHRLSGNKFLVSSYHPSRQNTQTGKLKWNEWLAVFQDIRKLISSPEADA